MKKIFKKLKLSIKKCRYIMAKSVIRLSGVTLINGSDFDGYIGSHQNITFFKDDLILLLLCSHQLNPEPGKP